MFLNLHTHNFSSHANEKAVYNIAVTEAPPIKINFHNDEKWYSAGIHPWDIRPDFFEIQLGILFEIAPNKAVKFIGECGLDRLKGPTLDRQEQVFIAQIKLAEQLNKPMIIHCVKCFNELIQIKKDIAAKVPMIIHGFNQNQQIGEQLLKHGFSFSIGAAILKKDSNAAKFLKTIPLQKLFLETDKQETISIEWVYVQAASILGIAISELEQIIFDNYTNLLRPYTTI